MSTNGGGKTPRFRTRNRGSEFVGERLEHAGGVFESEVISPKWTLNWLSYIQDDPDFSGACLMRYVAGWRRSQLLWL
jgi:hypothetical protein